jgi:hypothetical protein
MAAWCGSPARAGTEAARGQEVMGADSPDLPGVSWDCYDQLIDTWASMMLGIGEQLDEALEGLVASVLAEHGVGAEQAPAAIANLRSLFAAAIAWGQYMATVQATAHPLQNMQQAAQVTGHAPHPLDN